MILSLNKKASYDYQVLEKFEAGLVLTGQEVKSIRNKQAGLKGSYISIDKKNQVWLKNANIPRYKMAGTLPDYDPYQPRLLLLNKKEIKYLAGKSQQAGLTIIPLSLYTTNTKIKLEIGLVKGKKKVDKRHDLKEKDEKKKVQKLLKQRFRG